MSFAACLTVTTRDMTSYFLFWLIQRAYPPFLSSTSSTDRLFGRAVPFFFLNPNQLRWAFMLKTVVVPVTMLATMGSLVHSAGGAGPLFHQPNLVAGKDFSAAWLLGLASLCGNWGALPTTLTSRS